MKRLLKQLAIYNNETSKEQLDDWCTSMEKEVGTLTQRQKSYYYLLVSQVQAVKMANIDAAFQYLKKVNVNNELLAHEYKLHQIYYRFLEGDYKEAFKQLQIIEVTADSNRYFKKIATDFWKRVIHHTEYNRSLRSSVQQFEQQYIRALQFQRNNKLRDAEDIYIQLFKNYTNRDKNIEYEMAKHILLINSKTNYVKKEALGQYMNIVNQFQQTITNPDYYESKLQFLKKILNLIDPQNQGQDLLTDYSISRQFIISSIQKALDQVNDKETKGKLQMLLYDLEDQSQSLLNDQTCYKFLGEKTFQYLKINSASSNPNKTPTKKSKIKQTTVKPELTSQLKLQSQLKFTKSAMNSQLDEQFRGSNMIKVNMNSNGHEQRYFYFKDNFKTTLKLFYCSKKGKQSPQDDEYYKLKGFKKIQFGKVSQAFQRNECDQFPEDQCITLKISGDQDVERNFYVPNREDFEKWSALFQSLVVNKQKNDFSSKKTRLFV